MGIFLSSRHLDFEVLTHKHLSETYVSWLNDDEVCRYNRHNIFPYTLEKAKAYINSVSQSNSEIVLAMIERDTQKHIGNIALQLIDTLNRNADISILIGDKEAWGKSYAKEAFYTLLKHGFEMLNLHRIYCGTSSQNIAMQKVAIALGMRQEGIRREALFKNARFHDLIEYAILADEFKSDKGIDYDKK